ncbi:MAG: DJ-1/PfpI family protein [Bacteroidales bacterium]
MAKNVAILAVNPVNGFGLFNYLENFFENGISYKVFAVADTTTIKTNSGLTLVTDDVVANLKGKAAEFDALVFACGDAIPVFRDHAAAQYNLDMLEVIKEFAGKDKMMIGHCASALMFEIAGIGATRKLAVHPLAKPAIQQGVAVDDTVMEDGNFFTAQTEQSISELMPLLLERLK